MSSSEQTPSSGESSSEDPESIFTGRSLTVVSNRGPVDFVADENNEIQMQRSTGGLVTALLGIAQSVEISWFASAVSDSEKSWGHKKLSLNGDQNHDIDLHLVPLEEEVYNNYYNVIANPLLWFLQHSMWNFVSSPTITRNTWQAWDDGYKAANQQFANAVAQNIKLTNEKSLVMAQDYHLYLFPRMLRNEMLKSGHLDQVTITHFIHIPWPGPEDIQILPAKMRGEILEGLTATDLLGFQTHNDVLNFLRSVESHLQGAYVNYKKRRIWYKNHTTHVRDFPISIDAEATKTLAESSEVLELRNQMKEIVQDCQLILRVDRTEPSKNIVRGFQALGEMLELHPEHLGKVKFVALLVPSRLEVDEYRSYHDEIMAAAGWVNSQYGTSDWEPIRVILGENYARAIAALQIYDVLLVNSIADGMNLVAKEGAIVNQKSGALVLSERTGVRQQLEPGALIISPCDVYATAEALHQALIMSPEDRQVRASRLCRLVEENDIRTWLGDQLREINALNL